MSTSTSIPMPELLELTWAHAMPGREAVCQNELLRSMRELLTPRAPARERPSCA